MYEKDLSEKVRLRLSETDMNFLRDLSLRRSVSVSECIRSIIGEYRRHEKGVQLFNGDTETYINDKLQY